MSSSVGSDISAVSSSIRSVHLIALGNGELAAHRLWALEEFAALWISAPPSAVPAAGLTYAAVCFTLAVVWLVLARTAAAKAPVTRAEAQV